MQLVHQHSSAQPLSQQLDRSAAGPNKTRLTLFNTRFNVRHASGEVERRILQDEADYRRVLREDFGITLSDAELRAALAHVERRGTRGPPHPFFA